MSLPATLAYPLGGDASYSPITATGTTVGVGNSDLAAQVLRSPALDPVTNDLVITGGQLQFVSGIAYISQLIKTRLSLFMGEYTPDTTQGMPWLQNILVKGANPNAVRGYFNDMILGTPGVQSLNSLIINYNAVTRTMSVSFSAVTNLGLLTDQYLIPVTPDPLGS